MARDRNNLELAWQAFGEYEKAIGYFEQALAIFEDRLGPDHPSTRTVRENLSGTRAKRDAAGGR